MRRSAGSTEAPAEGPDGRPDDTKFCCFFDDLEMYTDCGRHARRGRGLAKAHDRRRHTLTVKSCRRDSRQS